MKLLDLTLGTAEENLALDEALLLEGQEVLRLWEWPRLAVVLGSGGIVADDVRVEECERDGVPILRRSSGGGTVLLGAGCLCFSLVLAYERHPGLADIHASYRWILEKVTGGLGLGELAGICDLALEGRKFSGNAQQRKRHHLLHHGTILHGFDLGRVPRYLREPPRRPEYRAERVHAAFVRNLPMDGDEVRQRLAEAWEARERLEMVPDVSKLVEEKYALESWRRRR
ncbi:MAG: lipoate--protein ligase family protein [Gemmataceae bacterium]|nr:lipoate--protein ligase family protein [Gemmataceae bacterium]